MHILIETKVEADYERVFASFNEKLFNALAPAFPKLNVICFEGCRTGDKVEVELDMGLVKLPFYTRVIEAGPEHRGFYFIDQGTRLPFFLKYWEHRHRIKRCGEGTMIVDDIKYIGSSGLAGFLIFPLMWLSFYGRKKVYRKYFKDR